MPDRPAGCMSDAAQGSRAVELGAVGLEPAEAANTNAVVTIANAHTNAHRGNDRVRRIADLRAEAVNAKGGQGLLVGAPAVSDALAQGTVNARGGLVSRDLMADRLESGHHTQHGAATDGAPPATGSRD